MGSIQINSRVALIVAVFFDYARFRYRNTIGLFSSLLSRCYPISPLL
jgi:hypothetical protein